MQVFRDVLRNVETAGHIKGEPLKDKCRFQHIRHDHESKTVIASFKLKAAMKLAHKRPLAIIEKLQNEGSP